MVIPSFVKNVSRLERFLSVGDPWDLDEGLWWDQTPQGREYWWHIYLDLLSGRSLRLKEAESHIKSFLGMRIIPKEEEAEWE